jgi:hypothetical protein
MEYTAPIKGLPSDEDIISKMTTRLDDSFIVSEKWRTFEVRENYALFEGNQWTEEAMERQVKNSSPVMTVNRTAPVVESICGFEIQNRLDVQYHPRLMDGAQEGYNDIMNNMVRYIEQNTKAPNQYSLAFKDMLICGVGPTNTVIDYDNNPDGEAIVSRLFPGFLFWDCAARAKNMMDSDFFVYIKMINKDLLCQQYGIEDGIDTSDSTIDSRILQFFDAVLEVEELGVVYEYQWRQKEPFYRVENPFMKIKPDAFPPEVMLGLEMIKVDYVEKYDFVPDMDALFSVDSAQEVKEIKENFEAIGIEIKSTKQHRYKYYRAIVTGGKVVEKSENYSQSGFSIKCMTGQFSELTQCYYGLVRACKDPQRMLNQAVSDYVGFLATIPKGGVEIESDAVDDVPAFVETYTKARHVNVYEPGGLMKSRPKITPPMPSGILEMIQYADAQIMSVCGVTPELMGMMQSKEMNSGFYRQQIRQGLTTLSTYFDAKYFYLQNQAELYTDCVRVLVDNAEGRLIKNVTGEGSEPYMPLTKSRVAAEYDIVVDETPNSPDENRDTFDTLIALQGQLWAGPNPVNIMPVVMQFLPGKAEVREQVMEMMQPPPPPEPDPLSQEILMSEINYKNASAEKLKADAYKSMVETRLKENELMYAPDKEEADINYTQAKTAYEMAKVRENMANSIKNSLTNFLT